MADKDEPGRIGSTVNFEKGDLDFLRREAAKNSRNVSNMMHIIICEFRTRQDVPASNCEFTAWKDYCSGIIRGASYRLEQARHQITRHKFGIEKLSDRELARVQSEIGRDERMAADVAQLDAQVAEAERANRPPTPEIQRSPEEIEEDRASRDLHGWEQMSTDDRLHTDHADYIEGLQDRKKRLKAAREALAAARKKGGA